ncbi:MAG: PSD1 and planctomycete cytochrome C domain-containing protein [Verrucomicrobiota bacterium]
MRSLFQILFFGVAFAFNSLAEEGDASKIPPAALTEIDFVRDIQPIFSASCYSCHGEDKQENDLRWDTKSSALKGGTSGLAIVPGKSGESRMIHLVAGLEKNLVMPKKGERLTAEQIGLLRAWIDQGANWPEEVALPKTKDKADWWSFKPATRPELPKVENKKWARNELDLFILAKLQEQKLAPSPEADRRTLIRRLSFDLIGLVPSPEEVEKLVNDKNPKAYENLVDRLLASPRYGERWARHWLDVVHFGETHGYDKDKPRLNAWPYRDYVIRSLNNDKPYSRFVEEQLAGDVLFPDESDGIVALGFIAAGPWDFVGHAELPIEKTDGLIARYNDRDDMVMTTMSTFQSLTVHCARCHNHKFDPIPQKEYYSLQAVFAGVDRADREFDSDKETRHRRRELKNEKSALELKLAALAPEKSPANGYHSGIEKIPDYTKWVQVDLGESRKIDEIRLIPARPVDFPDTPGFGFPLRFRVEMSDEPEFKSGKVLADFSGSDFANPGDVGVSIRVPDGSAGVPPASSKSVLTHDVLERATNSQAGRLRSDESRSFRFIRVTATKLWKRTHDYVFALAELQIFSGGKNIALHAKVSALDSIEAGLWSKQNLVDGFSSRAKLANIREPAKSGFESESPEISKITNRLAEIQAKLNSLPPPQTVYAATADFTPNGNFIPAKIPRPVHLLARGDVKQPRELMVPTGITAVSGPDAKFQISNLNDEGSRRAALAKWITDRKNMLTRRSIVNRVWQYHFGRGIVETANDFGHMGASPSHPELLDWLAFWFLENGESLKKLHRLIVTSATYRQSSAHNPEFAKVDSDSRFLWRMNRTRLDAETIHDSMLLISGKLDLTMGGPSAQQFGFKDDHSPVYDYTQFDVDSAAGRRRSIYRFGVRSAPDPLMDSLDCPDASILTPKRNVSMTSLQALAVLNDPFVLKQCEHFATRVATAGKLEKQIEEAYQLALNRKPTAEEMKRLVPFAQKFGMTNVARMIFNTSEFMFVD